MPDSTNKQTTIGTTGVTVTKRLEQEEFSDPVVAFDIESKREAPAVVTVVDEVPEGVSASDLRFHPEYGSEHWVVDDDELVFEREFEPEEEFITVYRLTEVSDEVASEEFTDPAVQTETAADDAAVAAGVEEVETEAESVDTDDGEAPTLDLNEPVVGDGSGEQTPAEERTTTVIMNGDDSDSSAADGELTLEGEAEEADAGTAEEDGAEEADPEVAEEDGAEKVDAEAVEDGDDAEPVDDGEGSEVPGTADGSEATEEGADGAAEEPARTEETESRSLVAELASEIEDDNVPEEDVDRLRAALGAENHERKSMVVRVEKLQRDVDEVLAYTDALAEFLDENGTGEELVTEFRGEVADFREEIGEFEAELRETQETAAENAERVDDLEAGVDDRFDDIHDELADLREEIDALRAEVEEGEVEERLSTLESDVDTLEDWRGRLASVMGEV